MICDKNVCTGCGACVNICPYAAISLTQDELGVETAVINENTCVSCGLCTKVCPALKERNGKTPFKCYAAWSLDERTRYASASGGVASELYKYECDNDGDIVGVVLDNNGKATYRLTKDKLDIDKFRNSKYVYSSTGDVYKRIASALTLGEALTFVGTPCQVAGLKSYLKIKKVDTEKLFTADLVCHGFAPSKYLNEHIKTIEKRYKCTTNEISFRDPKYQTHSYTFTLRKNGKVFYHKKVHRNDTYQVGYHSGIIYRENCYSCKYATIERQGDVTLADFSGVGSILPCDYDNKNVSCILINTKKGLSRILTLAELDKIYLEERPIEEELNNESQLKKPTSIPRERSAFMDYYRAGLDFDSAVAKSAKKKMFKNELCYYSHVNFFKSIMRRIIPSRIKRILKNTLKKEA